MRTRAAGIPLREPREEDGRRAGGACVFPSVPAAGAFVACMSTGMHTHKTHTYTHTQNTHVHMHTQAKQQTGSMIVKWDRASDQIKPVYNLFDYFDPTKDRGACSDDSVSE